MKTIASNNFDTEKIKNENKLENIIPYLNEQYGSSISLRKKSDS